LASSVNWGQGKSVALKKLAGDVVDRGGLVVVVDRTEVGEWVTWASSVTDVTIADVVDPVASLDPLRLFPPGLAGRALHSFLTPLLDITPTSPWGLLLSDVLTPEYLVRHAITSSGALVRHLATAGSHGSDMGLGSGAVDLARALNVYATRDVGRVVFDDSLPPVALGGAALVIRTAGLKLPSKLELETPHLFRQLPIETLFGRAVYALVAAVARRVCFTTKTFAAFVVDEAHHVTASPEGAAELEIFVRDGRKHAAAALLGSQDPTDFGSDTLRGLIPTRILMRQRDEILARRGLRWLDMDPDDEHLVSLVRTDTSPTGPDGVPADRRGEAFMRDANGRVGRVRILLPASPARATATLTTPTTAPIRPQPSPQPL